MNHGEERQTTGVEIAIVGMAGRFPGAANVDALWRNICNGVEAITQFSDDDLRERGVPAAMLADPAYVKAGVVLEGMERFDAGFFGYSPRDAEFLDPQHRLLLEIAWHALEHAGYSRASWPTLTGIYAGSGANVYLMRHLLPTIDWRTSDTSLLLSLLNANDKDSLATHVAYKLDLRGPAVAVQTACSTSLAAVHFACRGLLNHEADMALAGGVSLNLFQDGGYRYQAGAILSPDGHCRAFDARAAGTVMGSGGGIVVLKRLADALADRDTIHAVIKGSALNNDGAAKVGYTAPSVDGQAEVILAAQAMAEVSADSIGYVEAHGTGTTLGDPVEIAALTQAFRASTQQRGYCAIGSVKANIGHLDAAAGVSGLIKAILAVKHQQLPRSPNFVRPNPQIDFPASPFFVNTETRAWPRGHSPRRAGISSFGMGGTNVHVIVEEAPQASDSNAAAGDSPLEEMQLLTLSARSPVALEQAVEQLADHIQGRQDQSLIDVAHTLRVGRKRFEHRCAVLARSHEDAVRVMRERTAKHFFYGLTPTDRPSVVFLFPGQGSQYVGMGAELYQHQPLVRETVDRCCELLRLRLGVDLREILFSPARDEEQATTRLDQTEITQPALFVIEYAMARLWMSWGLQPAAMLGHSIGEYVAACLAGVFSLQDALEIVAARGRLMQSTMPGAMLAVNLPEAQLRSYLSAGCDLAAVNAVDSCVLSGSTAVIEGVERELHGRGVSLRRLRVSHAFHSALVEPILGEFTALLAGIKLHPPQIPFVSNVSGTWITPHQACSPAYWAQHVRQAVRFADGIGELLDDSKHVLLEVGPGETLRRLARRHSHADEQRLILSSQCGAEHRSLNRDQPARCVAELWVKGIEVGPTYFGAAERRRVPLPGYPFERKSYWIPLPAPMSSASTNTNTDTGSGSRDIDNWFYVPAWKRSSPAPRPATASDRGTLLLLGDAEGLSDRLFQHLCRMERQVVKVEPGPHFAQLDERRYTVRPGDSGDMEQLLRSIESQMRPVSDVCHLWNLDSRAAAAEGDEAQERGFHSLIALARALHAADESSKRQVSLLVVTNRLEDLTGAEPICPEKATLHGPCKVIPQEYPNVSCRVVDVEVSADSAHQQDRLVRQIVTELELRDGENVVAYRGAHRWTKTYEQTHRDTRSEQRLRKQGVYLITGGLGGIGLILARHLAEKWQAKLVLLTRSEWPAARDWSTLSTAADQPETLRRKLCSLLDLQSSGAEVWVLKADVSDATQIRSAIEQTRQRFGVIHGVIHAAGEAGGGMIASRNRRDIARVFAPKIEGVRNLLTALQEETPEFVLLCSSLAAVTGAFGQVDYCAANCFMDAVATLSAQNARQSVMTVNWDTWRNVGMAAARQLPDGIGIDATQAGRLLEMVLSEPPPPQVLVSTNDLERGLDAAGFGNWAEHVPSGLFAPQKEYARPALKTAYVPPGNELERALAGIWQKFLKIESIGVSDNFFELGGDSLLAIQLLAHVQDHYGVELHPAAFLKAATIAALALAVESQLIEEIERTDSSAIAMVS